MLQKSQIYPRLILFEFLVTGIIVYSDYGIAWDETFQLHDNGRAVWKYVSEKDFESYEKNPEKYHGPGPDMGRKNAFEIQSPVGAKYFARP